MTFRYFIHLSYKGTHYHGWQSQPNSTTVQETLEDAFSTILREKINITGAGRTDTGVHASYYIAHFDSEKKGLHNDQKIMYSLNSYLPYDIAIHNIIHVHNNAHARFDAISRTYQYKIIHKKDPFKYGFYCFLKEIPDIDILNQACEELKKHKDFTSFSKLHTDVKTNNCEIYDARWEKIDDELVFTIKADRFLRNMVRAIVGTLIDAGTKKISVNELSQIIMKKNRSRAGKSMPPEGLYLTSINYPYSLL